eukprot:TRINITY_DN24732_c0_g2_i1.p1 TRINITY_DN24732_c0_g2~~TRINITY_DN24732_c0_g2_i1.p1  ORF type:complete len:709 (+),score=149.52 TRINITY_DN24732_c0_g2_i1:63-2189(+)
MPEVRKTAAGAKKGDAKARDTSPAPQAAPVKKEKRKGASNYESDDALLDRTNQGRWTDSFLVLRLTRWSIEKGLEFSSSRSAAGSDPSSPSNAPSKKKKAKDEQELTPQELLKQFVSQNSIPVGLMVLMILTIVLIINGENTNVHQDANQQPLDDFYGVLGVARDSDSGDVKRAYKTLAKRWHPDRNPNCTDCQEVFSKIATAYETLSDEEKRAAYDESGGVATKDLKSPKSVPLTRENFDELVTHSNDVWIVQVFKPEDGSCAAFHPFWENQIQKNGHLVRFGRVDATKDQAAWLPVKAKYLPMVLKFSRHLGANYAEIFPITSTHNTPQVFNKFVVTSFPNIGLPMHSDSSLLSSWLRSSSRKHKVLFAIPGRSEEERYKSHLVPRKLASRWSELFEFRTVDTQYLHGLPADAVPEEVRKALPSKEQSSNKAGLLFFPAGGAVEPAASAIFNWPAGEEEMVMHLMKFAELSAPVVSAQSADLLCRSLAIRRVYCLVLLDGDKDGLKKAHREIAESREQYLKEVEEIRASGGEVSEDEDNFVVPVLRLLRKPSRLQPSVSSCYAPKFGQVESVLGGANAFLMDLDQARIAPLRGLTSFRGLYPQIAYEDSLTWEDNAMDPILSFPDCGEGLQQRFARTVVKASILELLAMLVFALFLAEMVGKALSSESKRWWIGVGVMVIVPLLMSPPFQRKIAVYLPTFLFTPTL